jgi:hypothetical protein
MKSMLVAAAAMLAVVGWSSGRAEAGCVTGAVIGGIAGHFVGHGLLGAGAGCAIGHHEAYRRDQERGRSDRGWDHDRGNTAGSGSSSERGSGYQH